MALIESDDLKIVKLELNDSDPITRSELVREIELLEKQLIARLDERDKAIALLQASEDRRLAAEVPVTREELHREIGYLIRKVQENLAERDKAIGLLQAFADKQPTVSQVAASVVSLDKLTEQKFQGVNTQIIERDANLTVAMAAAEKAVGKTEVGFTKELDAVKGNMKSEVDGLRREISDLKNSQWRGLITIVTLAVMAAGVIIALVAHH